MYVNKKMNMKKVLVSISILIFIFAMNCSVYAETETQMFAAIADFYDMKPTLEHPAIPDEVYVSTVISCNMVLKPKTKIHLSRYCESAVSNLNFYFNGSGNVQKGADYNNTVEDEIFYPSSGRISNSYLGGNISYKVGSEFQRPTGDKINLETPSQYQTAVIISSKVFDIPDMGVDFTIEQPTGDQSQPNYTATKKGIPSLSGRSGHWVVRFGTLSESVSGAFSFFKSSKQSDKVFIIGGLNAGNLWDGEWLDQDVYGTDVFYEDWAQTTSLNDQEMEICQKAESFLMEYNLNPDACDGNTGEVLTEEGWVAIDATQAAKFLKVSDGELSYPVFDNAWGRIYAVVPRPEPPEPQKVDYRPAKRVRIKSRISTYGGFKFNALKEGDVVKIYTVNGKKVAELNAGTEEGFEWLGREGTNNSGDWAKSGIYIYQIKLKEENKIISGTISFVW